ncbi:MAG TPA: TonB-dependent receptor [Chitinophagaceae bacterium]|nr:TonB-dependent receptor [Chitinophagaceae bacterium]
MKKKVLFVAACITGSTLFAQDSSKTLDPVIITANKIAQKQSTTGKVVTVITKEQIEKSNGRTVAQLLNEQAGITINGALNNLGANQTVYLRGANAGRTLILMDGIPVYDPSFINNDFDLNLLSLNNVESIEICRGAQSTLYGSDAVAGVINIITVKKDITKPFNVNATASAGSFGTYRGNLKLYGKADKLTYSARYAKLTSAGFSSAHDSTGTKGFDNDKYDGDVASALLQYQLSNDISFKTFIQHSRYKSDLDASSFVDEKDFTANNKSIITGVGFHYKKNNLSLTANYQYSEYKRDYFNDSLDKPTFTKYSENDFFGKAQFAELFSSIGLNKNFTLLQGADYRYSNFNSRFFSLSSFGPFTSLFNDTSHSQSSLYASLLYHGLNENLNVELGERLNVHSRYGSNSTYTFNPSYTIDEHYRIFGSIATGYKAPTLFQLYSSSGNRDLNPEKSKTYEVGFQQQHQKITNRIVYFNREIKNGIDFNNITFKYFNIAKQTVNGIEIESKLVPAKNLSIAANYTYLNPKENNQSRITFKDSVYTYLLRRPVHNFNITASYDFDNGLYISTSGKYVGKRYDVGGYKKPDVQLDRYFLLSAYAEYKFKKNLKIFADAQNITNKKFFDVAGYNSVPFLFNGGVTFTL